MSRVILQGHLICCLLMACLASGCSSGSPSSSPESNPDPATIQQGLDALPFPGIEVAPPRLASVDVEDELLGRITFQRSSGAVVNGDYLDIGAAPDDLEYAMYRFDGLADMDLPLEVAVKRSNLQFGGYCYGIADYTTQRWVWSQLDGSGSPTTTDAFPVPPEVDAVSPGGLLYVAIAVWNDRAITVESITLTTDLDLEAPVADFTVTPTHGDAPLEVDFDASDSFVRSDGNIASYGWDFDNDGTIDETNASPIAYYTFQTPGIHYPRLVVTGENGYTDEHTRPVYCQHWISTWGGSESDGTRGVVFTNHSLYTAGWTTNDGDLDCLVTKYSAWGDPVWQRALGEPGGDVEEYATGIAGLGEDGVVVAGITDATGDDSLFVASYDPGGNLRWQACWDSGVPESEPSIAVDGYGNTYVTALYLPDGETDHETALLKYSPEGSLLWQKNIDCWWDQGDSALCYFFGSLYFTSAFYPAGGYDLRICILDLDGEMTSCTNYTLDHQAVPNAISADLGGNVYVTGRYYSTANNAFLMKVNNALETQWFRAFTFDEGGSTGYDLFLNQYVSDPDEIQLVATISPDSGYQWGSLLKVDSYGLLTGAWKFSSRDSDLHLFAMCQNQYYGVVLGGCINNVGSSRSQTILVPPFTDVSNSGNAVTGTTSELEGSEIAATAVSYIPSGVHDLGGGDLDNMLIGVDPSSL